MLLLAGSLGAGGVGNPGREANARGYRSRPSCGCLLRVALRFSVKPCETANQLAILVLGSFPTTQVFAPGAPPPTSRTFQPVPGQAVGGGVSRSIGELHARALPFHLTFSPVVALTALAPPRSNLIARRAGTRCCTRGKVRTGRPRWRGRCARSCCSPGCTTASCGESEGFRNRRFHLRGCVESGAGKFGARGLKT